MFKNDSKKRAPCLLGLYSLLFLFAIFYSVPASAEGYATIKGAVWSKDENHLLIRYQSDFDTGSYDRLELFKVAPGLGKVTKNDERFHDGDNKSSPLIGKEFATYQADLHALPVRWIEVDPMTYAKLPWPHWPPQIGGKYQKKVHIEKETVTITLETYGDPNARKESGYRLFAQNDREAVPRLLASWQRPKDFDENKAKFFALGAIGASPSGRWITIFLRQFDQGFESSDAIPLPFFFPKPEFLGKSPYPQTSAQNSNP
jgi:hypothetical protein